MAEGPEHPAFTSATRKDLQRALVRLNRELAEAGGSLEQACRIITECAARELNIERCSLWLYAENREKMVCRDLYTMSDGQHSSGLELSARDYPLYFEAIGTERIIAAHDAHHDPQTREFSSSYLAPLGITSMLDAPIRVRGKLVGVVCHEHTSSARRWSLFEQSFAASIGDFTAQAMETAELYKSREALAKAQRIAQLGNWTLNFETGKWTSSREISRILGHDSDDGITSLEQFTRQSHPEDLPLLEGAIQAIKDGQATFEFEHRMSRIDGLERVIVSHIDAIFGDGSQVVGLNSVSHDVTELHLMRKADAAKKELEQVNQALQESQNALKKTLAALAHDVRTPIASLKVGLGRLREKDGMMGLVGPALRSEVEYLDALFANLVSLVRIEANSQERATSLADLNILLERLLSRFQFLSDDKNTHVEFSPAGEDILVNCNPIELEQAFSNIVHNALKYSRKHVAVLLYPSGDNALIEVRDDGPGFLVDEIEQLKDRFFSGELTPDYGRRGIGLGLTIVDDVITRHRGHFSLSNHPEGGACVRVSLPMGI